MDLLSVVVPVYNVEKYIDRCLDSIMNQTYQNLEIILVDDGSKDNSGCICDEYAKKDKRIKVVHKTNGGLSSARNAGLKAATGKYVGFIDSDDDIDLTMYEKMVNMIQKYEVDFVMADYMRIFNDGSTFDKTINIDEGLYDKSKIEEDIYPQLIMRGDIEYGPLLSVWHCLYRTEFLITNNIYFDEKVRWSEDNIFSSFVGYMANSFYYMKNQYLYHYYENAVSITTSYKKGAWDVYMTMNKHLHDYFDKITDYDFSMQLKYHTIYYACVCINQATTLKFNDSYNEIKSVLNSKELCIAFQNVLFTNISTKMKLQLFIMKHRLSLMFTFYKKFI